MNSFGRVLRTTIWGESHGPAIGCVVHGVPAAEPFDLAYLQAQCDRRRPGQSLLTTQRKEEDRVEVLSGVLDGRCTGAPISLLLRNADTEPGKYAKLRQTPRPGHADWPAHVRYAGANDLRGSGHFSGRLTAPLTAAGALARSVLARRGVRIAAATTQVGTVTAPLDAERVSLEEVLERVDAHPTRCIDAKARERMAADIEAARRDTDSLGGTVTCIAEGMPVGIGEPFFDSVESVLSHLLYAIPAVKAVEFGAGFALAGMRGSRANDPWTLRGGRVRAAKNDAGGILGGLTTGERIVLRVAVKPASSIAKEQSTVDVTAMKEAKLRVEGRHDPCIVPRAVPVVENVVALGLLDLWLLARAQGYLREGAP